MADKFEVKWAGLRKALESALSACASGSTVTYRQIMEETGAPRAPVQACAYRVRLALLKDGLVFRAVPTTGWRRLTDEEIARELPDDGRRRMHALALRRGMELSAADAKALDANERLKLLVAESLFGAMAAITRKIAIKRLEQAVSKAEKTLPVDETIQALRLIR